MTVWTAQQITHDTDSDTTTSMGAVRCIARGVSTRSTRAIIAAVRGWPRADGCSLRGYGHTMAAIRAAAGERGITGIRDALQTGTTTGLILIAD